MQSSLLPNGGTLEQKARFSFPHRNLLVKARDEVKEHGRIMADTAARLMGMGIIVGQLESRLLSQAGMA